MDKDFEKLEQNDISPLLKMIAAGVLKKVDLPQGCVWMPVPRVVNPLSLRELIDMEWPW